MKVKPNPYIISFDDGADGGPDHLLYLLKGCSVRIKNKGEIVCEGMVVESDSGIVTIAEFCDCCGQTNYDKPKLLSIFGDFTEVVYL